MNLFPLCTASVWPTKSGVMVLRRDQVLNTFFSFRSLRARIFTISDSSTYGPFFTLRPMLETPIRNAEFEMRNRWESISHFPFRISHYCVALPRLRPRTMSFVERFFLCRVFLPSTLPHGLVGGRPPELLPSPPPSGWSTGFIATPRTRGLRPSQRDLPALPIESSSCSALPTSPIVARHSPRTIRISVERRRSVT